jgi:CTP:molybdopterin cytidylyltransferase MocA
MDSIVYVILAAGGSTRMGFAKATAPLAGRSPLLRLADVLAGRAVTIVTSESASAGVRAVAGSASVLVNPDPDLGMTSSLRVADAAIDAGATLGVILADKPFLQRETLETCERALESAHCDVLYPVFAGTGGHPVYFRPPARARLAALAAGDTLRALRDDPMLVRAACECDDEGVALDLDTPEAWDAAERRLAKRHSHA